MLPDAFLLNEGGENIILVTWHDDKLNCACAAGYLNATCVWRLVYLVHFVLRKTLELDYAFFTPFRFLSKL